MLCSVVYCWGFFFFFFYQWCSPAIYCEFDGFLSAFQVSRIVYSMTSLLFLCKHLYWKFSVRLKIKNKILKEVLQIGKNLGMPAGFFFFMVC